MIFVVVPHLSLLFVIYIYIYIYIYWVAPNMGCAKKQKVSQDNLALKKHVMDELIGQARFSHYHCQDILILRTLHTKMTLYWEPQNKTPNITQFWQANYNLQPKRKESQRIAPLLFLDLIIMMGILGGTPCGAKFYFQFCYEIN